MTLDTRVVKLIEILGWEEDSSAWNDVFSKLFNGVTFENLHEVNRRRDEAIVDLIKSANVDYVTSEDNLDRYFTLSPNGGLITKQSLILNRFDAPELGIHVGNCEVYVGNGAEIVRSVIDTALYIGAGAKLWRTHVIPGSSNSFSYIGPGATVEEATQFKGAVIGSGINNPKSGYKTAYFHGDSANNLLIGGSSGVSDRVNCQSHVTGPRATILVDPITKERVRLTHDQARRTPGFIGVDCSIGDGAHLTLPTIIGRGSIVASLDGKTRPMIEGLVMEHKYYPAQKPGATYTL